MDDSHYDSDTNIYDIQEEDLKTFINEFYLDNPDKIPPAVIF